MWEMSMERDQRGKLKPMAAWPEIWRELRDKYESYLKVWADPTTTGLFTDYGEMLYPDWLPIPQKIWDELARMVADYDLCIGLTEAEAKRYEAEWDEIDKRGIELARRVSECLLGTPVYYWSEYRHDYLMPVQLSICDKADHRSGLWHLTSDTYDTFIKVMPEYQSTGLFTDTNEMLYSQGGPIPLELWDELAELVGDTSLVLVSQDDQEKSETWPAIDARGIELTRRIASCLFGIRVRYWSYSRNDFIND